MFRRGRWLPGKREWEWSRRDQATFVAVKRALDRMPLKARRQLFQRQLAPYGVTGVNAGAVEAVHEVRWST